MASEFKPNMAFFARLEKESQKAMAMAAESVKTDLILSQTMPFDQGTLQNTNTFVAPVVEDKTRIITQGPQARRLYFHPEYNFQTKENPFAGGRWLDPYLPDHEKGDMFRTNYARFLRKEMGG